MRKQSLAALAIAACSLLHLNPKSIAQAQSAAAVPSITILHTNDMHARVTPHQWIVPSHSAPLVQQFEAVGGAAYFASKLLERKQAQPDALVLDAGDLSEGNPIGDMGGNSTMLEFYKQLDTKLKALAPGGRGFDAVVVGNHDVRFKSYIDNLASLDQQTGGHVISVNVCQHGTQTPYFHPYTTVTINGIKIGIVGYTTNSTVVGDDLTNIIDIVNVDWTSTDATKIHMANYVNTLRTTEGCNLVVLLTHAGHTELCAATAPVLMDNASTARLPEVAITGHWHTWTDTIWQPEILNYKTIFSESGSYHHYLGQLTIDTTGKYISSVQYPIQNSAITPDTDIASYIASQIGQYQVTNGAAYDRVIGYSADDLVLDKKMKWWSGDEYPWDGDNSAGQWICDAVQWKAAQLFGSCDLSIEAGGGVRSDVKKGPVRYTDIYETFPWPDDVIYMVKMSGQEIYDYFKQHGCDVGFSKGWFVTVHDGVPVTITKDGQPISLSQTYNVAINNYMYLHDSVKFSDTNPQTSTYLARQSIVDYTGQFTATNPLQFPGNRYSFDTEFSGGYRAVVMMMNDADSKPQFEDAFIRFLGATPETLARRGTRQVPGNLVNGDGTINYSNRLSENELYRSFLGFKTGALKPGDIIETYGKGSFYQGDPEFVDQEGVYGDGVEFKIVGHDASLAQPTYCSSINAFWNDNYKNHYVKFFARKTGANTVSDYNGTSLTIMDVTAYAAKALPGNTNDLLVLTGVPTSENFGLRFRCDTVALASTVSVTSYPPDSHVNTIPLQTGSSNIQLSATTTGASTQPSTYSLAPVADSYLVKGSPTTNNGTKTTLFIESAATGSFQDERAILKFNLASIPAGSTITGATLNLYCWGAAGPALPTELRSLSDDSWTETGVTWSNQPSLGPVLSNTTLAAGAVNVWYTWDATSFVQSEFAGDKTASLLVKPTTEGSTASPVPAYKFDSREYTSTQPYLQVTVSSSGATTPISQVQYYYRYSADHLNWNAWTAGPVANVSPWTASFTFPNGDGYYEFYSVATDSTGTAEPAPALADAATYYNHVGFPTVTISTSTPKLSKVGPYNGSFTIVRSGGDTSTPLTVGVSMSGIAQNGSAFAPVPTTTTIPAGASSVDVPIAVNDDSMLEGGRSATMTLLSDSRYLVGLPASATVTINDETFEGWSMANFGEVVEPTADSDHDGVSNLLEYALGMNGNVTDSASVPKPQMLNGQLTLTFTRPKAIDDLQYVPEVSSNLGVWLADNAHVSFQLVSDNGATQTWRATSLLSGAPQFIHLRVNRP